jgi:hypothetical protein
MPIWMADLFACHCIFSVVEEATGDHLVKAERWQDQDAVMSYPLSYPLAKEMMIEH